MRKLAALVLVLGVLAGATASGATDPQRHTHARQLGWPGAAPVSVRVPPGWDRLHGWLSDVRYPIPVLAVGSFPVHLSRHSCACAFPNVAHFPRNGSVLVVSRRT